MAVKKFSDLLWADIKLMLDIPGVAKTALYIDAGTYIKIGLNLHGIELGCILPNPSAEYDVWLASYKSKANSPVINRPPFSSNASGDGHLENRTEGKQFTLSVGGENVLEFVIDYGKVKFDSLEINGGEKKDKATLRILDTAEGTYSGTANKILNEFGTNVNIKKDEYKRDSNYEATLYAGMRVVVLYDSISAKDIEINYSIHEVMA